MGHDVESDDFLENNLKFDDQKPPQKKTSYFSTFLNFFFAKIKTLV
jgi:hypothetical protein